MTRDEAIEYLETLEASEDVKNPLALLESLKNTREEAKTNREALEDVQTKLANAEKFRTGSKSHAITRELRAAGVKNPDKIVKLMDVESIELDDEGSLQGFDEQFELTKTDWPELFDVKRQAPVVDQNGSEPRVNMSATQVQMQAIREAANR